MVARAAAVALLVAALGLSGCFGGGDDAPRVHEEPAQEADDAEAPEDGPPFPAVVAFHDCMGQFGVINPPADIVEAALPAGFRPDPIGPGGTAWVVAGGFLCDKATFGDEEVRRPLTWLIVVDVIPPPEYEEEHLSHYRVTLELASDSAALVDLLQAWNVTARAATLRWQESEGVAMHTGQVGTTVDGYRQDLYVTSSPQVEDVLPAATTREFFIAWVDGEPRPVVTAIAHTNATIDAPFHLGAAKLQFDTWGSGPDELAPWLLFTALATGLGVHIWWDDTEGGAPLLLEYIPLPVLA